MSYSNLNPTQRKNLEKIEEYLLEEKERKAQLSNFQQEIFWQILNSFREDSSVKFRSFVVSKLKEYNPYSSLARKALALFLKDSSPEIIADLVKIPEELAAPQLFDLFLSISEQVKGKWETDKLVSLYKIMYLSGAEKFVRWAKEIFGTKSFLKKKLLEVQKEALLDALLSQNDSVTFRFSGEFLKDPDLFLSQSLRNKILSFREYTRVRRKKGASPSRNEGERTEEPLPLSSPQDHFPDPEMKKDPESFLGPSSNFSEFEELAEGENLTHIQRSILPQKIPGAPKDVPKDVPKPPKEAVPTEASRKENRLKYLGKRLADQIPREFDGYILQSPIGIGGMGVVYRALQKSLDRTVAIKMLPPNYNPENYERFLQEAKIGGLLNHPNIVHIISYGVAQGHPYFVMEYVDGSGLDELVAQHQELKMERILSILRQIALALSCAHRHNIVHRDIKASNVMINQSGDVKVMDFGLAKGNFEGDDLTQTGVIMGTPRYMAPEQASAKEIDARADIYSLGVIFFELVTGELPFKGSSGMVVLFKHVNEAPPGPDPSIPMCRFGWKKSFSNVWRKIPTIGTRRPRS